MQRRAQRHSDQEQSASRGASPFISRVRSRSDYRRPVARREGLKKETTIAQARGLTKAPPMSNAHTISWAERISSRHHHQLPSSKTAICRTHRHLLPTLLPSRTRVAIKQFPQRIALAVLRSLFCMTHPAQKATSTPMTSSTESL